MDFVLHLHLLTISRYLNELRKRIKEEFEEKGMLPKLQTNIAIKNCEEHTELRVITNEFTIKPQKNGYQFKSENPELYITAQLLEPKTEKTFEANFYGKEGKKLELHSKEDVDTNGYNMVNIMLDMNNVVF